jgi:c-di-GMP-related signal transduction protein
MLKTEPAARLFLARQPILDRQQRCVAYELLSRSGADNAYTGDPGDGDAATMRTLDVAMHLEGLANLAGGKRVFINVTRSMLVHNLTDVLPPQRCVLELLETVPPDDEVIAACRRLKALGYQLALDDFTSHERTMLPLLDEVDIIKIDFPLTTRESRRELMTRFAGGSLQLLAEKVETPEEFAEALDLGFHLFQGYFFCRPQVIERRQLPMDKQVYLRFLQQIAEPKPDFSVLEETIRSEPALSLRLLSYLNSASLGVRERITSIHHALTLLGETNLRRWAGVFALSALSEDKTPELTVQCLNRAFCGEALAPHCLPTIVPFDAFLAGLLSGLDAVLDRPMPELLRQMNASVDVKSALLGGSAPLGQLRRLVLACEHGDTQGITAISGRLGLGQRAVAEACHHAARRTDGLLGR